MKSQESKTEEARDVLWEFRKACPVPTADDVRAWQARNPEHADVIAEKALVSLRDALDPDLDGDVELAHRERAMALDVAPTRKRSMSL